MNGSPPFHVCRFMLPLAAALLLAGAGCSKRGGVAAGSPVLPPPAADHVAFTADGKTLAANFEAVVKVWDVSGNERVNFTAPNLVDAMALSPDGRVVVVGCIDKSLALWDATTGKVKRALPPHKAPVKAAAFSPDGKLLATAAGDHGPYAVQMGNIPCEVKLWDAAGTSLGELPNPGGTVFSLAFSPDGQTLATASYDGKIKVWDPVKRVQQNEVTIPDCPGGVRGVGFSRDGKYLASGCMNGTVQVWDAAGLQPSGGPKVGHNARVNTVAFSPSGKLLASASDDGTVKLWDTGDWAEKGTLKVDGRGVYCAAFGADDATLATGGQDGAVHLWDALRQEDRRSLR
jgi:WD40 repeat protein